MPTPLLLYKYDEASSGSSPTNLLDTSAGTALNAALTYAGSSWAPITGGRALALAGGTANGGLTAILSGTKVATALTGAQKCTLLVVVDTTLASSFGNAIGIINNGSGDQVVEIEVNQTQARVIVNNAIVGLVSGLTAGLHIFEAVIDTPKANPSDRVVLYDNGVVAPFGGSPTYPAQNSTIDAFGALWGSWRFAMGVYGGGAGLHATIGFGALYATANTAAEAAAHATALLANNDADPDGTVLAPVLSRRRPVTWPDDAQEVVQRRAKLVKDGTVQADTVLRARRPQTWAWQEPEPWQTARRALLVPSAPAAADQVPCRADALLLSWEPEAWPDRRRTLLVPATPVVTADTVLRARGQASPWWDQVDQVAQRRPLLVPGPAAVVDVVLVRRRAFGQDWDQVEAWPIQRRPDFVSQTIVVANTVLFRRRWLASVLEQWPTDWTIPRRRLSPPMPEETRLRPPLTVAVDAVRLSVRVDAVELTVAVDPIRLSVVGDT